MVIVDISYSTNFGCRYSANNSNPMTICSGHGHCNVATNRCFVVKDGVASMCASCLPKDYLFAGKYGQENTLRWLI